MKPNTFEYAYRINNVHKGFNHYNKCINNIVMVLKLVQSNTNCIQMDKELHIACTNENINIVKCKQTYTK